MDRGDEVRGIHPLVGDLNDNRSDIKEVLRREALVHHRHGQSWWRLYEMILASFNVASDDTSPA